jgi:hypothetical protein
VRQNITVVRTCDRESYLPQCGHEAERGREVEARDKIHPSKYFLLSDLIFHSFHHLPLLHPIKNPSMICPLIRSEPL